MPRSRLAITPKFLPFDLDNRTYDPGLVVETEIFRDVDELEDDAVWKAAPLTRLGRLYLPLYSGRGWRVHRQGEPNACALLLQLERDAHRLRGLILSTAVEHARMERESRFVIVAPERVLVAHTGLSSRAWPVVADLLLGTLPIRGRPQTPPPLPPAPDEDLDALASLSMSR